MTPAGTLIPSIQFVSKIAQGCLIASKELKDDLYGALSLFE